MMTEKWEKIGVIGVDAGICWLGDPCYILHQEKPPKDIGKDWSGFCNRVANKDTAQFNFDLGHAGLGVMVSTGLGDGCYDVFAQFSDEGEWGKRIKAVKVVFIEDD